MTDTDEQIKLVEHNNRNDTPNPSLSHRYGTFSRLNRLKETVNSKSKVSLLIIKILPYAIGIICLSFVVKAFCKPPHTIQSNLNQEESSFPTNAQENLQLIERQFLDVPKAESAMKHLRYYTRVPHSAGTQADYERALYTAEHFERSGIIAEIKEYYTLLSAPRRRNVTIIHPPASKRTLKLAEAVIPEDSCTADATQLPPFLAYSATGSITGSIVYVNYGRNEDYQYLIQNGVELEGKIAIARYGINYRGLKTMLAQHYGMIGILIYSDPADDGFRKGKVYPEGPWRPETSVQRGSVQFNSIYPGDPLTPGYAATASAPRLELDDASSIPKIPALPLSYGDAYYILRDLKGDIAPSSWRGGLNISYRIGTDDLRVHIDVDIDNSVHTIWNVIGRIPGEIEKNRSIILGNHRDAWVCGGSDPNSASSALLEIATAFGALLKKGWKPRRTIILGSWDGEEPGLLGSTEWVEDHKRLLYEQTVAYLNMDSFKGTKTSALASPAISKLIFDTSRDIKMENTSLWEHWLKDHSNAIATATKQGLSETVKQLKALERENYVGILGSGSDYTPFYQHLGIISADLGFDGPYGVYHSSMDSFMWMKEFGDPTFEQHVVAARWWGLIGLRLADSPVLPIEYETYATLLQRTIREFQDLTKTAGVNLDYSEFANAINNFTEAAKNVRRERQIVKDPESLQALNDRLMYTERLFLHSPGLPQRPWYKHQIFAPGIYLGYGGTAFPGLADAIAVKADLSEYEKQLSILTSTMSNAAEYLAGKRNLPEFTDHH